jgi:sigma-B regulation protein RsbU (phosphoserine phosphatase)
MVLRGSEVINVEIAGVPLGLLPRQEYEETTFKVQPGDIVILYSDGVSDHVRTDGEEYGRSGLSRLMANCQGCTPNDIVQSIFTDLDNFNTVRFDDQTLIVMRVL